jgi:hypothetical protein
MDCSLVLTVAPAGYSSRGQQFDATLDGRLIVARSPTPLCDACRVLPAEGNCRMEPTRWYCSTRSCSREVRTARTPKLCENVPRG